MKNILIIMLLFQAFSGNSAIAALYVRNNESIYNDVMNLSILKDVNSFKTFSASDPNLTSKIISSIVSITDSNGTRSLKSSDFDANSGRLNWWGAQAAYLKQPFQGISLINRQPLGRDAG